MSVDRPGPRAVTSGTMSSPRCPICASRNTGTPPQFPRQDTTGVAGYVTGTGLQRRAGARGFSSVSCGATADRGRAWPGLLPPEDRDGRNVIRVASQTRISWSAHQPGRPLCGWQAAAPVAATLPQ